LKVVEATQCKNELIVTHCKGFHWGYNTGFNLNCAKNFAPKFWLPYGLVNDPCPCP
jgi:hypothetical protein